MRKERESKFNKDVREYREYVLDVDVGEISCINYIYERRERSKQH